MFYCTEPGKEPKGVDISQFFLLQRNNFELVCFIDKFARNLNDGNARFNRFSWQQN